MNPGRHNNDARKNALEEASNWVVCLDEPDVTRKQLDAWHAWMQASSANVEAFNDISLIWESAPHVSSEDVRHARASDARTATRHQPWITPALRHRHPHGFSRKDHGHRQSRLKLAAWAGACASVLAIAVLVYGGFPRHTRESAHVSRHYTTAIGEHRQVALADGSTVDMGAASELTVDFTLGLRRVELRRGEAYFSVKHENDRPFEVRAGGALIRDLGTRFDVGYTGDAVTVTVDQGKVQMSPLHAVADLPEATAAPELSAGDQATFIPGKGVSEPRQVNLRFAFAWRDDVMVYRGTALGHIIDDMNRYSTTPIELGDVSLEKLPVTGRWNARDVSGWVHGLAKALSLTVQYTPERILLVPESRGHGQGTGQVHSHQKAAPSAGKDG